jgi:phenylacetate-CoA ligase
MHAASLDEERGRRMIQSALPALRAALWSSPGWRQRLRGSWLSPDDLGSLDDLAGFPLLDRRALAESWDQLPVVVPGDELVVVESSGSTGRPLRIVRDEYECLHMWAVLRFWMAWLRIPIPPRPRVVLLCALPGRIEYSTRLPILEDGALHRIATGRAGAEARLRRVGPAVVFSDPAGAHWLASLGEAPAPSLFLSSAQHFPDALRARLSASVPAPALNYYSTTETGPIAWECMEMRGRLHVLVPEVWVESLEGELVVTRLRPSPLPLLRYRTGDRGRVERDDCRCGYRGWSLYGFEGRRCCDFVTPTGDRIDAWQLAWLFKHHPLGGFRLTQDAPSRFRLETEAPAAPGALAAELRFALVRLGWSHPEITLAPGSQLDAPGGKPEPFRCALEQGPPLSG